LNRTQKTGVFIASGFEFALTVIIMIGLGYHADKRYQTTPLFLLIGLALGFSTALIRLLRTLKWVEKSSNEKDQ